MILGVDNNCFTNLRIYLSQKDWIELWKSCFKVGYTHGRSYKKTLRCKGEVVEVTYQNIE